MHEEGPELDTLLHRLADCPPAFLAEPVLENGGEIHVDAVVCDLMWSFGVEPVEALAASFRGLDKSARNWSRTVLVVCWLAADPWFVEHPSHATKIHNFLTGELDGLAEKVDADALVSNGERREELVRLLLHFLGLRPAGETAEQASDRLQTVSTIYRERVLSELRARREREEKLRKEMAQKRAREAASRYSRE